MSKKTALKLPSVEAINLLFEQARNASLKNMAHAAEVDKAMNEVGAFLGTFYQPQTSSGLPADAGAGSKPQASANAAGS